MKLRKTLTLGWVTFLAVISHGAGDEMVEPQLKDEKAGTTSEDTPPTDPCEGRLALITGATGRVGTLVTNQLLEKGFCVRVLTRNATKAREKFGGNVEVVVGQLGDGTSVARAFQGSTAVSHVIYTAGGEEADFDAVNNRGVAECASEAVKAASQTMVVISAAWVSKPYSLASILFNMLFDNLPMARHLQGEDGLRKAAAKKNLNYVILRAGNLVPDEEFPNNAPRGLLYEQGDKFAFFGAAGMPGMCNTQLANAVLTAMEAEGRITVEVTGGLVDPHDSSVYFEFEADDVLKVVKYDDVEKCHREATLVFQAGATVFLLLALVCFVRWRICKTLALIVAMLTTFICFWTVVLSDISVMDCASRSQKSSEL